MDGKIRAAILMILSFSTCVYGMELNCPFHQDAEGKCFKNMTISQSYDEAVQTCNNLGTLNPGTGNWRLPLIGDLANTELDQAKYWVLSPRWSKCLVSASAKEGKLANVDCSASVPVICIQISGNVESSDVAMAGVQHFSQEFIPKANGIQLSQLGSHFQESTLDPNDEIFSSATQKRKKRQVRSNDRKVGLTQRKMISRVRAKAGRRVETLQRKFGSTRRLSPTDNNNVDGPKVQDSPTGQSSAQEGQTQLNGKNNGMTGENDRKSGHQKKGQKGKRMCMGMGRDWKLLGGICVYRSRDKVAWEEAKTKCEEFFYHGFQATLGNIENERIRKWLHLKTKSRDMQDGTFWTSESYTQQGSQNQIAGTDPLAEQEISVPENSINCVSYTTAKGEFQPDSCSEKYRYICQMESPILTQDDLVR